MHEYERCREAGLDERHRNNTRLHCSVGDLLLPVAHIQVVSIAAGSRPAWYNFTVGDRLSA
jgi:hypothetical protein